MIRKALLVFAAALALVLGDGGSGGNAAVGSPHLVGTPTATRSGDVLTVDFKVAGLGGEDQTVTVTADAACVNRGGNEPRAENKGAVLASGVFSPKNGNITGSLSGSATTDPSCVPPMELRYSNVTVDVQPADIHITLLGTY